MELGENLFGLCLGYLNIVDYNWMINLVRPEVQPILCKIWRKANNYKKEKTGGHTYHYCNGKSFHVKGNGVTIWVNSKQEPHRIDGPAITRNTDNLLIEHWYFNGHKHRIDGPASVLSDGSYEWWVYGKRHRQGGPAIISIGVEEWWVYGQLHREDGPAVIRVAGIMEWWLNGQRHREDGPAVMNNGTSEWWVNNKLHRTIDGPAIIRQNGSSERWVNGYRAL